MTFPFRFGGADRGDDEGGGRSHRSRPRHTSLSSDANEDIVVADRHLVERLRAGDPLALREIVEAHGPTLLTLASAVVGVPELGDDVVQQVFIRLWDCRETLEIRGTLRQYLWRATRNQAISLRRYEHLRQRVVHEVRNDAVSVNEGVEALEVAALQTQIMEVLSELPKRCREIFLLSWRDSLTPKEIAQALGISVATVRNQILRAVKHLGTHFGYR